MKLRIIKTAVSRVSILMGVVLVISSCNKDLPEATPIIYPPVNAEKSTIGETISDDANYSFYKAAATRVGALAQLMDTNKVFTVFVPDNNAFMASGITSEAMIGAMPVASVAGIVQYSIIPGDQILAADIPEEFPNAQMPTTLSIGTLPGTPLPLKLTTFLSRRGTSIWVNTIPVTATDKKFRNGVIHQTAAIVAPPSTLLKQAIYSDPDLSFFKAGIARADSGAVGLERLDSLLGYGVTNMTLFVPNNQALQSLLFGSIYAHLADLGVDPAMAQAQASALVASPAVFENPALFSVLTAQTVKGILVYHFLATNKGKGFQPNIRAFSNNFSPTPHFYKTLLNAGVDMGLDMHPGVMAQATFTGPFVTDLKFTGMGTFPPGGEPFSGEAATAVKKDVHCVNGVYHVIDKVLLPQ